MEAAIGIPLDKRTGKFFMDLRPARKPQYPLHWEFPGGKVEEDESPRDCMLRELKEEVGITVTKDQFLMHGQSPIFGLHVFLVTEWTGNIGICEDQVDFNWYTPEEGKYM